MAEYPTVLTIEELWAEASKFAISESARDEPALYGVTDGKSIGTHLERRFVAHLNARYTYDLGNSASGIDFPGLGVDIKVTSSQQPQSSCPYKSARQKIYGLGYDLLVFVYLKTDNRTNRTGCLNIQHAVYIEKSRTADFQMTTGILEILDREGNEDDLIAFMSDKNLPVDDIEMGNIARDILMNPPKQGYLTISNALQWRLQYSRAIQQAGAVEGVSKWVQEA